MASLTWTTTDKERRRYVFYKKATTVGSAIDNDVVLPKGEGMNPHHARVIFDGRDFSVVAVDKGSAIHHKGKKKSKCRLKDGDVVTFASLEASFSILDSDQSSTSGGGNGGEAGEEEDVQAAEIKGLQRLFDFSRVMIDSQLDSFPRVDPAIEVGVGDQSQRMGNNSHLMAMFTDILLLDIPHQTPSFDQLHAG